MRRILTIILLAAALAVIFSVPALAAPPENPNGWGEWTVYEAQWERPDSTNYNAIHHYTDLPPHPSKYGYMEVRWLAIAYAWYYPTSNYGQGFVQEEKAAQQGSE